MESPVSALAKPLLTPGRWRLCGLAAVVVVIGLRVVPEDAPTRHILAMALAWPATLVADVWLGGAPMLWGALVVVVAAGLVEVCVRERWWFLFAYVVAGVVLAWIGLQALLDSIVGRV